MVWDLKQKVYVNNPHTLQKLENEIRRVLSEITERERERERERELQKVFQNFIHRCDYCIQKGGNHFRHMF